MSEPADETTGEAASAQERPWRKAGRCSACTFFESDFGDPPDVLGHCKMYPRPGSREAHDMACPEYKPRAGFDDLTRSTSTEMRFQPAPARSGPVGIPSGGYKPRTPPRPPRPHVVPGSPVVRRRDGEGIQPVARALGRTLPEDVLRLFGSLAPPAAGETGDTDPQAGGEPVDTAHVRDLIIDVIENFIGIRDVEMLPRFQGGTLVIKPENPELQAKEVPVEDLFHKIVMIRDNLRRLEQKVNAHEGLSDGDKVEMQQYISRCYGSLTTFNLLFKNERDKFSSR